MSQTERQRFTNILRSIKITLEVECRVKLEVTYRFVIFGGSHAKSPLKVTRTRWGRFYKRIHGRQLNVTTFLKYLT